MDLKEMVVTAVYQSPDGLGPLEIVEALARQFDVHTTARQVLDTVRGNPKLFVEANGRIARPSEAGATRRGHKMDLKDMMVAVVYQSPKGLVPLEIIEGLARQFDTQTNTKQVLQTVQGNPKLFVEKNGRVMRPSDDGTTTGGYKMGLKDMMVAVVYQSTDGLVPLEIVEALARQFDTQTNTKQVLQTVQGNPNLFVERNGRVMRPT